MFQPYNPKTASTQDRVAWALCQMLDDDAPLRWARYRFAAECIAHNEPLMADLMATRQTRLRNLAVQDGPVAAPTEARAPDFPSGGAVGGGLTECDMHDDES